MDAPTRIGIRCAKVEVSSNHLSREASIMKVTTIGIDLAKNVFQVHGIDDHGKAVLKKQIKRDEMAVFFSNLTPCLIGMEACGSAHYWARKLRLLPSDVVNPRCQGSYLCPQTQTARRWMADKSTCTTR
jgi:transposase